MSAKSGSVVVTATSSAPAASRRGTSSATKRVVASGS
ncbi:MAG: hypothetical protein ABEJ30_01280, partial [Halorientalis sp.]